MLPEAHFHNLARQVSELLNCGAVCLLLGCPEPELRHPLLKLFSFNGNCSMECYGSTELASLLDDERVCALSDLAVQRGQVQTLDQLQIALPFQMIPQTASPVRSLAVVPLECPAGVLGLFLLADPRAGAFGDGEFRLMSDYIYRVTRSLEQDLRDLYSHSFVSNPGDNVKEVSHLVKAGTMEAESSLQKGIVGARFASIPIEAMKADGSPQKELDQLKNEFVSMVSHELRTPLSAIKGYAGLLQAYSVSDGQDEDAVGGLTPARQQQYLDIIMEQANHLEVLIGDLLDVSRIQAGRLALRLTNVDVALLCQQVTDLARQRVEQQQPGKYSIRCILAPELPAIWADPDRVQQALTNLLDNAIKYSPDGGPIEVVAYARRSLQLLEKGIDNKFGSTHPSPSSRGPLMMHITVRDSGIGISHQQQPHLFKPFSRLEQSTTDRVPGTGLGLYITRKLVEAMGGRITLRSRPGEGTSVMLTLPVACPEGTISLNAAPSSQGEKSLAL